MTIRRADTGPEVAGRLAAGALAAGLLAAVFAGAPAAEATDRSARLAAIQALVPPLTDDFAQVAAADALCVDDPAGDTFWLRDPEDLDSERVYAPEPRADIRSFCVEYGPTLSFAMTLADLAEPATDWRGDTGAFWFLDTTGDAAQDHVVIYEYWGNRIVADVFELTEEQPDGVWRCAASAGSDGSTVTASAIDPGCLGGPDRIVAAALMMYDTGERTFLDIGAYGAGVGRPGAPTHRAADRLAGATRYETAVAISRARYPNGAAAGVYLARSDDFADALAGGSLASNPATDGPILLVPDCGPVPGAVLDEVARLDPQVVTGLGGEAAVCTQVLEDAAAAGGGERGIDRLAGVTRYGTAARITQAAFPDGAPTVYLATGEAFPDALAAGPLDDGPVLLTPSCDALPGEVTGELERLAPDALVALGGRAAICDEVLGEAVAAAGLDGPARRLAGPSRFETAVAVSRDSFDGGAPVAYVARADDFPDALAGAVLRDGPILLVPSCGDLPGPVGDELRRLDPGRVVALGGGAAVCAQMLRHAANA